jgi:hypothetical protein
MPSFDEHCKQARTEFGNPFPEVHRWLDEYAGLPGIGMRHRCKRHHRAGIEEARQLFGNLAAEVARQHILADLKMEGWTENDPFPKDELHYKRLGLF